MLAKLKKNDQVASELNFFLGFSVKSVCERCECDDDEDEYYEWL